MHKLTNAVLPRRLENFPSTNQGVDECVFVTELCLKKRVLLAELLHLLSELGKLFCLQPVHLRAVSLTVRLTLVVLT